MANGFVWYIRFETQQITEEKSWKEIQTYSSIDNRRYTSYLHAAIREECVNSFSTLMWMKGVGFIPFICFFFAAAAAFRFISLAESNVNCIQSVWIVFVRTEERRNWLLQISKYFHICTYHILNFRICKYSRSF